MHVIAQMTVLFVSFMTDWDSVDSWDTDAVAIWRIDCEATDNAQVLE